MNADLPYRCRGAAFIYVMLIFLAASIIAAGLLSSQRLEMDRTAQFLDETQAMQYALGAEIYARQVLYDDMLNHADADYSGEAWSGKQMLFSGAVEMEIEDLHGRFNVNSLLGNDPSANTRFKALCDGLGIPSADVDKLFKALQEAKGPPLPPNRPPSKPSWMADPSELVDYQFPVEDYRKLAPYVTALPSDSHAVNINTASDVVLRAYLQNEDQVATIRDLIKQNGFIGADQLDAFSTQDNSLQITSDAFRLHASVRMQNETLHFSSLLLRLSKNKQQGVFPVARMWGD